MTHPWKDLIVLAKSHELVLRIYKLTSTFPDNEKFGLCQQMRRAASSVAANIVEGNQKKPIKNFLLTFITPEDLLKRHGITCFFQGT